MLKTAQVTRVCGSELTFGDIYISPPAIRRHSWHHSNTSISLGAEEKFLFPAVPSSPTEAGHKFVMPVGISQSSHARLEAEICQFLGHSRSQVQIEACILFCAGARLESSLNLRALKTIRWQSQSTVPVLKLCNMLLTAQKEKHRRQNCKICAPSKNNTKGEARRGQQKYLVTKIIAVIFGKPFSLWHAHFNT